MVNPCFCSKSDKLDAMEKNIHSLNKIVIEGNGEKGLVQLVTETRDFMQPLVDNMEMMDSNIKVLMRFQTQTETAREVKAVFRQRRIIRTRWITTLILTILIAVSTILAMFFS